MGHSYVRTNWLLPFMLFIFVLPGAAHAYTFGVLHTFQYSDGEFPNGSLLIDRANNLYGTSIRGGAVDCGVAYSLAPNGTENVLYSFNGGDGCYVSSGLTRDEEGTFYGTTSEGGQTGCPNRHYGCGAVFTLTPAGTETVLHYFGKKHGSHPAGNLALNKRDDVFGTAGSGGSKTCECGIAFKIAPGGETIPLHVFLGGSDGASPGSGLLRDKLGNLYGVTAVGGGGAACAGSQGCGTVFEITANGNYSILYAFSGGSDGAFPSGELAMDNTGNLYGTTEGGGTNGFGTTYELTAGGVETVLHSFAGGSDGSTPATGVILGSAGDIYGTTQGGGGGEEVGVVFHLAPSGTETTLYSFTGKADGAYPQGLTLDAAGDIYGTALMGGSLTQTCNGGAGCGTVFKLTP